MSVAERVQTMMCAGCSLVWNCGLGEYGDLPEYTLEGEPSNVNGHEPYCLLRPENGGHGHEDWTAIGEPRWRIDGEVMSAEEGERRLMARASG